MRFYKLVHDMKYKVIVLYGVLLIEFWSLFKMVEVNGATHLHSGRLEPAANVD
jgi:cbb3-type cytochrome oxidase subunit 1